MLNRQRMLDELHHAAVQDGVGFERQIDLHCEDMSLGITDLAERYKEKTGKGPPELPLAKS